MHSAPDTAKTWLQPDASRKWRSNGGNKFYKIFTLEHATRSERSLCRTRTHALTCFTHAGGQPHSGRVRCRGVPLAGHPPCRLRLCRVSKFAPRYPSQALRKRHLLALCRVWVRVVPPHGTSVRSHVAECRVACACVRVFVRVCARAHVCVPVCACSLRVGGAAGSSYASSCGWDDTALPPALRCRNNRRTAQACGQRKREAPHRPTTHANSSLPAGRPLTHQQQ